MIRRVAMYSAYCNICDARHELGDGEVVAYSEIDHVLDTVREAGDWAIIEVKGKKKDDLYCENCHTKEWDESGDNLLCIVDGKIKGVI